MSRIDRRKARTTARLASIVVLALLGSVLILVEPTAGAPAADSAFVRVNQVGYPSAASKRAYLMSSTAQSGAFSVQDSTGATVFSAPIGQNLGRWSTGFPNVYALDFNSVMAAGNYTISVSGPIPAISPSFRIDVGAGVYSEPLANALSFYQTERDGPNFIPSALRTAPAHLNDQNAMTYLTCPFTGGLTRGVSA